MSAPRTVLQAVEALLRADGVVNGLVGGHFPERFARDLRHKFRRQVTLTHQGEATEHTSGRRCLEVTAFAAECVDRGRAAAEALALEVRRVLESAAPDLPGQWAKRPLKTGSTLGPVEDFVPEDGSELWRATLTYSVTVEREKAG